MHRLFATALLLVGIVSFLPAQQPASGKSIARLIDQLGDPDFKVRETAAKAIEDLGPEALPALRKAKDHPDLEVRRRIRAWIPKLELEAFVGPKRVSLDVKQKPLAKVVGELARQSGYQIEWATKDDRTRKPVTLRSAKTTFWEALDKVCREGELELRPGFGRSQKLTLDFVGATSPYRAYQGAFRVRASGFHYLQQTTVSKDIDFARMRPNAAAGNQKEQKQVTENFTFRFDLMAEPRLTILYLGEPNLTEALDDQKRSLLPKQGIMNAMFGGRGRFFGPAGMRRRMFTVYGDGLSATASMSVPVQGARSVKLLRGTIPVYLEKEKKRTVLVENLAKAQGKKFKTEEFIVEIEIFKHVGGNGYRVNFSFTRNRQDAKDSNEEDGGFFELEDAKGRCYKAHGSSMSSDGTTTEANISFGPSFNNAAPLGPPVRLVYIRSIPLEHSVTFEFKDLPLP